VVVCSIVAWVGSRRDPFEDQLGFAAVTGWGTFVFAGLGILAMRGGHLLSRRNESIATRIAAVLFLLPLTPLWIVSLPVGILVFRTLGRADVQRLLEDPKSDVE
jgi:hypothetical protein